MAATQGAYCFHAVYTLDRTSDRGANRILDRWLSDVSAIGFQRFNETQ